MKRLFEVTAKEFTTKQVECTGCSGHALALALQGEKVDSWKVSRRSADGLDWFFDVTISGVAREFKVKTLGSA